MWRIIRAEIAYNRLNYVLFLALLFPVLGYGTIHKSVAPTFLAWLFMFLMVNNWNAFRIREKRSFQLAQLPLPAIEVGMARSMMILLLSGSYLLVYGIVRAVALPDAGGSLRMLLCLFALTVTIFSAALIFRDRFVGSKALGQGKTVLVVILGGAVLANIYFLIMARRASRTGAARPAFIQAIEWVFQHNPAGSNQATAAFVLIALALSLLSAYTFTRRRTHVE